MAYNTKAIKKDLDNKPVPQIFDAVKDDYEVTQGRNGAQRFEIYGPDGSPLSTTSNKLDIRANEIETILDTLLTKAGFDAKNDLSVTALRDALRGASSKTLSDIATALAPLATSAKQDTLIAKDFATQTTLASILAKIIATPATEAKQDALNAKDFATQTTLAAILAKIIAAPATEAKQDALITKDFATQTTLAAVLEKLSADPATQATLAAVLTKLNAGISTTLSGSNMELYGASINDRPAANTVPAGATFTIVDRDLDKNWISDGTSWEEV